MFEPIKVAFGEYMHEFFKGLVPTTKPMQAFVKRPFHECVAWAPGRMVDAAEDMLSAFMRSDVRQEENKAPYKPVQLPVIIAAMARDHMSYGHDFNRPMYAPMMISIPGDPHNRMFEMRTLGAELRIQVCVFAHDEPTARSIAAQFQLYMARPTGRRMFANFPFAGFDHKFPCVLEDNGVMAANIPSESKNLTILALDLTWKCTVPLFKGPGPGEPNDNTVEPYGYPKVEVIDIESYETATGDRERATLMGKYVIRHT